MLREHLDRAIQVDLVRAAPVWQAHEIADAASPGRILTRRAQGQSRGDLPSEGAHRRIDRRRLGRSRDQLGSLVGLTRRRRAARRARSAPRTA